MGHFRPLFHVLLRKSDYVTTYRFNGIINRVRPNQNKIFESRFTWSFYDTIVMFSLVSNYVPNPPPK